LPPGGVVGCPPGGGVGCGVTGCGVTCPAAVAVKIASAVCASFVALSPGDVAGPLLPHAMIIAAMKKNVMTSNIRWDMMISFMMSDE
jgi:hypothetical protein